MRNRNVLLINPWVRDFKCYDEWMEPLGLLWIAALLKPHGIKSHLVDCLDRFSLNAGLKPGRNKKFSTGDFPVAVLEKPALYRIVPRLYKQYGISESCFRDKVRSAPAPDLILVSSAMTYWCGGVRRAVELVRKIWPKAPLFWAGSTQRSAKATPAECPGWTRFCPGR